MTRVLLDAPAGPHLRLGLTTRDGGVSSGRFASLNLGFHVGDDPAAVLENRRRAASAWGRPLNRFVYCQQVGGNNVVAVSRADQGRGANQGNDAIPACDALVTTELGLVLALMAADCMLIALHDPVAQVVGLVHAGWPGATNGVIPRTVRSMTEHGAQPARMTAFIGPAVPADRYQVGDDVAAAARAALGSEVDRALQPDGTGRYLFDLPAAAEVHLTRSGLASANIQRSGEVTGPDTLFYSHRFEGPTGRFAMFAELTSKGRA